MEKQLQGKTALVGGGSAGIGKAVAEELARRGATVLLLARTAHTLDKVCAGLNREAGQNHDFLPVDFSRPHEMRDHVAAWLNGRPVHILVNNSGGPPGGPIREATPEAFLQAYNSHLVCNHLLAQLVLSGMQEAGYGRVVNIISTSVKEPLENLGVSNSTRWAVAGWSKTWATEVGRWGITVNNVLPGFTETARLDEIISKRAEGLGISTAQVAEQFKAVVPAGRFAKPEEVAYAVAFLASPEAAYINGISLPVDGGRTKSL